MTRSNFRIRGRFNHSEGLHSVPIVGRIVWLESDRRVGGGIPFRRQTSVERWPPNRSSKTVHIRGSMNVYADLFGRNRVLIALIAVVFSSLAGYGITFLEIDDTPRNLFAAQDDDFKQLERLFKDFGSDDNDCVVVLEGDSIYSPQGADAIRSIIAGIRHSGRAILAWNRSKASPISACSLRKELLPMCSLASGKRL